MGAKEAQILARMGQEQAIGAAQVIQQGGLQSDEDRYRERLALAVANPSEAIVELTQE